MKFTYWVAPNLSGDMTDAIVGRTKHECEQKVIAYGAPADYGTPIKKAILYTDVFDLFDLLDLFDLFDLYWRCTWGATSVSHWPTWRLRGF